MQYPINKQQVVKLANIKHPLYTRGTNALKSAALSGGVSATATGLLSNGFAAYHGENLDPETTAALMGTAGLTGAVLGGTMHNSKDTLVNNALVPAAIAGTLGVLSNAVTDGEVDNLTGTDIDVHSSQPINVAKTTLGTGALGGASWYLRNIDKKKNYV